MRTAYLLPGFDGSGKLFARLLTQLESHFECVSITYSDHHAPQGFVAEALKQMRGSEGSILVAESFSGPIAALLAAKFPRLVSSLILSTTFHATPHRGLIHLAEAAPDFILGSNVLRRWLVQNVCLNGEKDTALIRETLDVVSALSSRTVRARLRALSEFDVSESLRKISVPTLVLGASRDRLLQRSRVERLQSLIPRSRLVWIEGPHLLLQSRPAEAGRHIVNHVGA